VRSIALPRSSASLSLDDEVPHIFARKSRLKLGKFLITSAKRLLQQNLPKPAVSRCSETAMLPNAAQTKGPNSCARIIPR
jgi:hypothetical protein